MTRQTKRDPTTPQLQLPSTRRRTTIRRRSIRCLQKVQLDIPLPLNLNLHPTPTRRSLSSSISLGAAIAGPGLVGARLCRHRQRPLHHRRQSQRRLRQLIIRPRRRLRVVGGRGAEGVDEGSEGEEDEEEGEVVWGLGGGGNEGVEEAEGGRAGEGKGGGRGGASACSMYSSHRRWASFHGWSVPNASIVWLSSTSSSIGGKPSSLSTAECHLDAALDLEELAVEERDRERVLELPDAFAHRCDLLVQFLVVCENEAGGTRY
ncbi:hypothetical protein FPV67DRAFT_1658122 [Lyophyllum atratum]|nr:hypothetical protein FPV67DRAFT_1658122 [Lyophyllum atratum]